MARAVGRPRIIVSHSSQDLELVQALVALVTRALHLRPSDIRCTSVSGHKLAAGAPVDETLRGELTVCDVMLGLITNVSVESAYVLFELGARWGSKRPFVTMLGAGAGAATLRGPLHNINTLSCESSSDIVQMLAELARLLRVKPLLVHEYMDAVERLVACSRKSALEREPSQTGMRKPRTTNRETTGAVAAARRCMREGDEARNAGNWDGAIKAYGEAIRFYESIADERGRALTLWERASAKNNLGLAFHVTGLLEDAVIWFSEAIALYELTLSDDKQALADQAAIAMANRALAFTAIGQYDKAEEDYGKACSLFEGVPLAGMPEDSRIAFAKAQKGLAGLVREKRVASKSQRGVLVKRLKKSTRRRRPT